ncbi:hypothetical protein Tco_0344358 [Tanacetum coccineum]
MLSCQCMRFCNRNRPGSLPVTVMCFQLLFIQFLHHVSASQSIALLEVEHLSQLFYIATLFLMNACSFMLCDLDFEPLSLSLSSLPSCDLVSFTNILILCLILKASNQSLRKSLSLNLKLSR